MSPITHAFLGWLVSCADPRLTRRERGWVTVAGVAPDVDALGTLPQILTARGAHPVYWGSDFHHVLGHNLLAAAIVACVAAAFARRRGVTAALAFASFHLHILGDLVGSRGGDGYTWPMAYLFPFDDRFQLSWSGQWELDAWPNFVITALALAATFVLAWRRGYAIVELLSPRADRAFVDALRARVARRG